MPLRAARILWFDYGFLRSARAGKCVDAAANAIPWYSYPAIEYLKQLDFTNRDVFEFGSGQSTLFWAQRARRVVSVEDDEAWYGIVSAKLPPNCEMILEKDIAVYPTHLARYPDGFDVIVVDGASRGRTRNKCARAAIEHLRPGGLIILDNSDWLPMSAQLLRESGLIEVDMAGFGPLLDHTQTTSLFFHRAFNFAPIGRQPLPAPGAVHKVWEHPPVTEPPLVEFGGEVFCAVRSDLPFEKETGNGVRRFRLLTCRPTADHGFADVILDVDRQRVLLAVLETDHSAASPQENQLAAVVSLPWEEFRTFIAAHPKRRYVLD
jgi:hypothetical protein